MFWVVRRIYNARVIANRDVMTLHHDDYVLTITSLENGLYHVQVVEEGFLRENSIIDMTIAKDALFDVINSARNKGYLDEDGENLVIAKYSL